MKTNSIYKPIAILSIFVLLASIGFILATRPAAARPASQLLQVNPPPGQIHPTGWEDNGLVDAPIISANPVWNSVAASGMPIGTVLTLTVSVTDTILYTSPPATVIEWPDNPGDISARFDMMGFDIQAGQALDVFNVEVSTVYTVTNFTITDVDPISDTVAGISTPSVEVQVCAGTPDGCAMRFPTADEAGNWLADFSKPGPRPDELEIVDIMPGSNGWGNETDAQGNQTWSAWNVPAPQIAANPVWNSVSAGGMPVGTVLTLTVSVAGDIVYTSPPATVIEWPDNPGEISARFDMMGFDVNAGQMLSASNPEVTSEYTVTNFAITTLDVVSDTVAGISTPGVVLQVCANTPDGCAMRLPIADDAGSWLADFSKPGPRPEEWEVVDIKAASNGWGNESDNQGNQTWSAWNVPNPRFEARANVDEVTAWEWPVGEVLTLQVGEFEITGTVTTAPWDPNQSFLQFVLKDLLDIRAGDLITLTNGTITKTTVVTDLEITWFDVAHDVVYGKAAPGSSVYLWACNISNCINVIRHVVADEDGVWKADFSVPGGLPDEQATYDLVPTTWVDSQQMDEDGDATMFGKSIPYTVLVPVVNRK